MTCDQILRTFTALDYKMTFDQILQTFTDLDYIKFLQTFTDLNYKMTFDQILQTFTDLDYNKILLTFTDLDYKMAFCFSLPIIPPVADKDTAVRSYNKVSLVVPVVDGISDWLISPEGIRPWGEVRNQEEENQSVIPIAANFDKNKKFPQELPPLLQLSL